MDPSVEDTITALLFCAAALVLIPVLIDAAAMLLLSL
jgi:hypothetical protein